jgi:hypothetical protein
VILCQIAEVLFNRMVGMAVKVKTKYDRLKKEIDKIMKFSLKDIEDGDLRYTFMNTVMKARELLDGKKPSISRES